MTVFEKVASNVNVREGRIVIKQFVLEVYFHPNCSTKHLSRKTNLPVPIISAIKKELRKENIVDIENGTSLTTFGKELVETELHIKHLNLERYYQAIDIQENILLEKELEILHTIYMNRPSVDVTLDQSKCTIETGIKRAIYVLKNNCLFGSKVICIGDDDLISVACCILYKYVFDGYIHPNFSITVMDHDIRILDYINKVAKDNHLPIHCIQHDLREPLPNEIKNTFDCVITDPPYTKEGLELFVSRGIYCLKNIKQLSLFLSFSRKPADILLSIQHSLTDAGLLMYHIEQQFNEYEGAQIIGGVSDLYHLLTTELTLEIINTSFHEKIYTRQHNPKIRRYQCLSCKRIYSVGIKKIFVTIEELKNKKCPNCYHNKFKLIKRRVVK